MRKQPSHQWVTLSSMLETTTTHADSHSQKKEPNFFHRTVARLIFLVARPRRDCRTAVAFLTTRVLDPDEDDWVKLKRVLRYLKRNPTPPLGLEADDISLIHWHVDALFAVHADMKSHTDGTMSYRKGSVIDTSHKQTKNTRSSTEAELTGADDVVVCM